MPALAAGFVSVLGITAGTAAATIATGVFYGIAIGALVGGVSAALKGGNILKGALTGALIGGITGGIGGAIMGPAGVTTGGIEQAGAGMISAPGEAAGMLGAPVGVAPALGSVATETIAGGVTAGTGGGTGFLGAMDWINKNPDTAKVAASAIGGGAKALSESQTAEANLEAQMERDKLNQISGLNLVELKTALPSIKEFANRPEWNEKFDSGLLGKKVQNAATA